MMMVKVHTHTHTHSTYTKCRMIIRLVLSFWLVFFIFFFIIFLQKEDRRTAINGLKYSKEKTTENNDKSIWKGSFSVYIQSTFIDYSFSHSVYCDISWMCNTQYLCCNILFLSLCMKGVRFFVKYKYEWHVFY